MVSNDTYRLEYRESASATREELVDIMLQMRAGNVWVGREGKSFKYMHEAT